MHENIDLVFHEDEPEALTKDSSAEEVKTFKAWHRSKRMAKNTIRNTMSDTVRGSVEEPNLATDYMEAFERKFKESEKAEAAKLYKAFHELKYEGFGGVREHIMKLIHINARLRELLMGVNDSQVVHVALHSLPNTFSGLRTSYNALKGTWTIDELISICADEEDRIKKEREPATSVNLVEKLKKKKNKLKVTKTITKPSGNTAAPNTTNALSSSATFVRK
ncbi:uncharacterized protein LOC112194696 [Rosa chinensis]|uniref:uncharacterized protein LOC112194696 n=1 Tax=Rosa chinensis TaxID=74649 RepID=UPI000D0967DA|nr:uncharacterized protein LOC112194696 [Rosa chinensis]